MSRRKTKQLTVNGWRATINTYGEITIHRHTRDAWERLYWFAWPGDAVRMLHSDDKPELVLAVEILRDQWRQGAFRK
jgi:hypothetical protein